MLYLGRGGSDTVAPEDVDGGHSAGYGGGGVLRVEDAPPKGTPSVDGLPGSELGGVGGMHDTRAMEKCGPPTMSLKFVWGAAAAP